MLKLWLITKKQNENPTTKNPTVDTVPRGNNRRHRGLLCAKIPLTIYEFKPMKTKLFLAASLPLWALATWSCLRSPEVETVVQERIVYPENVEACVSLTKFQLEKMLRHFNEDDHPSETKRFKSLVKRDGDNWKISSTHLAKGAEKYSLPDGDFVVVDASFIDYHGGFKDCVTYAHSYQDNHEYIVLSAK